MIINTLTDNYIAFREIHKDEPEWLYRLRREAWDKYQLAPLPERIVHLWKYTKPEWFLTDNPAEQMQTYPRISGIDPAEMAPLKSDIAAFGCNHGDRVIYTQISDKLADSGLIFTDLMTAIHNHPDLVRKYLGRLVDADFGKFEAYNLALWNSGMFLYIPPDVQIEEPIFIHRHPNVRYNNSRLLAVAERNSRVTIIDDYAGKHENEVFISSNVTEIFAEEGSNLRYVSPQNLSGSVRSYITQRILAERDAQVHTIFVALGGDIAKHNMGTILNGRGAQSQMLGILFGNQNQHFDHHTMHHHQAGDSYSNIDFKVVLKDKALSAYTGLIKIDENTLNCEAYQENRNLLLNKGARAESIPELEILNDQVRCSHGATVGPLDPEMVFYLMARGFDRAEAVRTIVRGFIEPLLKNIPEDLQKIMRNMVEYKLTDGTGR